MEKVMYNFKEAMKKGIVLWVIAHLLLYVICSYSNEMEVYHAQIDKLHNPINFVEQLVYAGLLYVALEVTFKFFVDNIFKFSVKGDTKRTIANAIVAILILAGVCVSAYLMKITDIVNKNIAKIMIALIFIKAIVGVLLTVRENVIYNSKLQEKNKE